MIEFDPRNHIDRLAEQELFRGLVARTSAARMLTVCDKGGRGKSSLLRKLRYNCQHEIKPPVPVCLLELDRLSDPSPFTFVCAIAQGFVARGMRTQDRLAKFNELYGAMPVNTTLHDIEIPAPSAGGRVTASATASIVRDNAKNIALNVEHAEFRVPMLTGEQVERARAACVEALFDDLRATCATQPMVLLLDGWENCNLTLRQWIVEEMLGNHVFHLDPNMRPDRFSLVIAGRPYEPGRTADGLRSDDFSEFFDSNEEFSETVLSIKSLSLWESEHVSEFLVLAGCPEPTEAQVNLIQEQVAKGISLEKILSLVDDYFRPDRTP